MAKIDNFGEFFLIERLSKNFPQSSRQNVIGIGDDCSATVFDENLFHITTTDLLIEGVHFLRDKISPYKLGQKAVAVSISDIAAMGGIPENTHLSLGLPGGTDLGYFDEFFKGFKKGCDEYSIELLGGDTTKSPERIVINVSLQGKVEKDRVKLRSGARPGDIVCLTGVVGDSGIGLGILLKEWTTTDDAYFIKCHNEIVAHIKEGRWLSQFNAVHAMIDISDGIASDIKHICRRSHVRAEIELADLPLSTFAQAFFTMTKRCRSKVVSWGEDYCLLVTIAPQPFPDIARKFQHTFGHPLHTIGIIKEGDGVHFTNNGGPFKKPLSGYDHFERS